MGAIQEMLDYGLFMAEPVIALTEDGINRAERLGLISGLKKRSSSPLLNTAEWNCDGTGSGRKRRHHRQRSFRDGINRNSKA